MPKERRRIAHGIAQRLFAAEEALDIAAARIAELNAALPLARLEGRLAAAVGQEAYRSSAAAVLLVAQTREEIIITHAKLKQASDDIGLGATAYGDVFKPEEALSTVAPALRAA